MENFFEDYFSRLNKAITAIDDSRLLTSARIIKTAAKEGRKVLVVGNGGSAAIASHVSVDFTKAAGIRSVNFNEADLLTCFANDYGYENWVSKAFDFYADESDAAILISSSGKSPNIVNGAKTARDAGLKLITLSGFSSDNPLRELGDVNFWVDSQSYNTIEMTHYVWLLSIIDYIINEQNSQ